ncbi:MAG: hypothetical protein MMC33_004197 [Icmadophila ericetorum]|nr:hypothetical protein [Icmadophila ericetorum]
MTAGLAELPTEVLSSIVVHLRTANALLHLSLTCKRLHDYIETDGFRVFVKNCFPSIHAPPHWKDAARSLTDLSRSWDRKAFSARYLIPPTKDFGRSTRLYERRQTMGYQPVIDSYAEQTGSSWASQKEVLAWGAGAKLIVRMINPDFGKGRMTGSVNQSSLWMEVAGGKEGRDDITSVNLLRPNQKAPDTPEQIIIGRANGELERIQTPYQDKASKSLSKYFTGGRHVRSAAITTTRDPLLAASLSDGTVVVYPVHGVEPETRIIEPFGDVSIKTVQKFGKIWTTRFLAPALLAVGSGMSKKPLNIYNTGPDRISNIPLRSYQPLADDWWYDAESGKEAPINSVYSIAPLELSSSGGGNDGEVFLSGWFAGAIQQVHSIRDS